MQHDSLEFTPPTLAEFRQIRYWIHRHKGESCAAANEAADIEADAYASELQGAAEVQP